MLQNIRDNSQSWISKIIIAMMVVLMALFGVDQIFQATSNSQNAAEVNGIPVPIVDVERAADMQRRQLQQQLGANFDPSLLDDSLLRNAALQGLIDQELLLQAATSAGFAFPEQAIDQIILQEKQFQVDDKFNSDRFDAVLRQMGYTRQQFRQMLRDEMLIGQLRAGVIGSSFVTETEAKNFALLEKQTRDFAWITMKASTLSIDIIESEIKQYYDEHPTQFMSPEQLQLEYVELRKDGFFDQIDVTEEELQVQYQKDIAGLAEQRQAAHILIEVDGQVSDAQAKAKLQEVQQKLAAGEDFAVLAKDYSADSGSAGNGGDLGYAGPGVYDPEFETALYALKVGEVSAPVRTSYGWHLIKLLGVQDADIPPFASLKDKLLAEIKEEKVEVLFVDASKTLEDSAFEASDLAQPAQELGLEIKLSDKFGRQGGQGLLANRQVLKAAFSEEVLVNGANSELIELDADTVVVVRVKEHDKPEQLPLEAVSASIRDQLIQQRAAQAAKAEGEELLTALREGKISGDEVIAGQTWSVVKAAARNHEGVAPQVTQALFRMPKPAAADKPGFSGVALDNGDFVLLRLNGVNQPEDAISMEELLTVRNFLSSRIGQQDFAAYRRQLQDSAEIERF